VTTLSSARSQRVLPFVLLAAAEVLVVFRNAGHFFTGDSLFWMWNRYSSVMEGVRGFFDLDPALWYRPLSQRTLESILYPLAGLNPTPYRIAGFMLFFACTLAVFLFALRVTQHRLAAWAAVLIFTPHVVSKFVAYDVAFTPELLLLLFSLGSAACYVAYLRQPNRSMWIMSAAFLAGALLSKETAAGLPFALMGLWFLLGDRRVSFKSLVPHFAMLAIYLVFAFAFLHVRNLQVGQVLGWLPQDPVSEYQFEAGNNIRHNLRDAFAWTFGIPAGVHGQWIFSAEWILPVLSGLRVLACIGAFALLFTARRRLVLAGICWFITMLGPALLLKTHFLPYYLFVPLAGIAVAGGTLLDWIYEQCKPLSPRVAGAIVGIILAAWTKGQVHAANRVALTHPLLGAAAIRSGIAWEDVHRSYPTFPSRKHLVFLNEGLPSAPADQGFGLLFKLGYGDPSLVIHYSTIDLPKDLDVANAVVFQWAHGRFLDVTSDVRQNPKLLWRSSSIAAHGAPSD